MPGIFGALGTSPTSCSILEEGYCRIWGEIETKRFRNGIIGGHAFGSPLSIHSASEDLLIGVDGEWSLYQAAEQFLPQQAARLFSISSNGLEMVTSSAGNVAVIDNGTTTIHLATDWTGTFPLYYVEKNGGFLFSSHLRPLARAVSATRDDIGTLEFLRQAYTVMGKTQFSGIRRLLPGQSLRYRLGGSITVHENSLAWSNQCHLMPGQSAEHAWELLNSSLESSLPSQHPVALMMSAGWDSRMLLAGARRIYSSDRLTCYTHGDMESREINLVRKLCETANTPLRLEGIGDNVFDTNLLNHGFERTENLVFPHWHRAGAILKETGIQCNFAGVYGEILGGHYGPATLRTRTDKITRVCASLLGRGANGKRDDAARETKEALRLSNLGRHWYLHEDFENTIGNQRERINAEIDLAVDRLERRGISSTEQLIEAYISEHRGTQYINAQMLSCRAHIDIALPFADRELFHFASGIPLVTKIHNKVNQQMLRFGAAELLKSPMAATLLPASMPILAQEASRIVRKIGETAGWKFHSATRGRISVPRLGWVNFQFLKSGNALRSIIDDLRCDIWDRAALERRAALIERGEWQNSLHPMYDQMCKIYTVDMLLR